MIFIGIAGQSMFFIQGIKIFYTKSAGDVSLVGFLMGLIAVSSWLGYGVMIKDKVLIIANIFAVIGAFLVLSGIFLHG